MNRTLLIIAIIAVGGLVLAFVYAPADGLLSRSSSSATPTSSSSDHGDAMAEEGGEEIDETEEMEETTEASEPEVGISSGDLAADFTLETFSGETVSLSDFRGQAVLIDFWAAWCPFCVAEMPELEKAHQQYGEDLVVLGIHRTRTESVEKGQEFADDRGVTYRLLKDSDDAVYRFYSGGQNFMPIAYYIDAQGIIQSRILGPKSTEQIEAEVMELIAESN